MVVDRVMGRAPRVERLRRSVKMAEKSFIACAKSAERLNRMSGSARVSSFETS